MAASAALPAVSNKLSHCYLYPTDSALDLKSPLVHTVSLNILTEVNKVKIGETFFVLSVTTNKWQESIDYIIRLS